MISINTISNISIIITIVIIASTIMTIINIIGITVINVISIIMIDGGVANVIIILTIINNVYPFPFNYSGLRPPNQRYQPRVVFGSLD